MLKKSLSILLTLVLSLSIVAAYPIKGDAKAISEKVKKEYKSKKEIKDGDVDIIIEENSPDDVKITAHNRVTNYTVSNVMEKKDGKVNILSTTINSDQDKVIKEYTVDEQTNTINSLPPVLNEEDPGHEAGGYYYTFDNLRYIAQNPFNPDVQNAIPYSHVNPYSHGTGEGYGIGSNITTCKEGTLFYNVQIASDAVSELQGYQGIILGGMIGGILSSHISKDTVAQIVGTTLGAFAGACAANFLVRYLKDERGCIWVRIDKNPAISTYYETDAEGRIHSYTDYTFKTVMVGPYWRANFTVVG